MTHSHVLEGPALTDGWRRDSLTARVLAADPATPLCIGTFESGPKTYTLGDVRDVAARAAALDLGPTVALYRAPHTNDAPLAVAALGLLVSGRRVVLPSETSMAHLGALFGRVAPDAVFLAAPMDALPHAQPLERLLTGPVPAAQDHPAPPEDDLWLTTSGTTGAPSLVRHSTRRFLGMMASWEAAGLLDPSRLGGPSINPTLSHSMGVRDLIRALYTGSTALFVTPEWLTTRPYQVIRALTMHPPAHLTCGPALLHTLAFLARKFPMLQERVLPHVRCVVSSGTAADSIPDLAHHGIPVFNALGATETLQITTSANDADPPRDPATLGGVLPGVSLGLLPTPDPEVYALQVRTPFGACDLEEWWDSGDLVRLGEDGALRHVGRRGHDFVQTGHGVKVSRKALSDRYARVHPDVTLFHITPHPASQALVALALMPGRDPSDPALHEELAEHLAARHEALIDEAPFELAFATVCAVGVVAALPPTRGPGKLDAARLEADYADLLDALADPYAHHPHKVEVPDVRADLSAFWRASYPRVGELLGGLGLDWTYTGGRGDVLIADRPEGPVEVLDLVGGYGVNLLGHNHPDVLEAAQEALSGLPMLAQGSHRARAGELCRVLTHLVSQVTGRRYVCALANTGAETVELALKHAMFERGAWLTRHHASLRAAFAWRDAALVERVMAHNAQAFADHRPPILALERAFHGKTLGALHALGAPEQRAPFRPLLGVDTVFLPARGGERGESALAQAVEAHTIVCHTIVEDEHGELELRELAREDILAVLAEPIMGEGGVLEVPLPWLERLAAPEAPLLLDEVQCGLGRAGSFLASQGVRADYYAFGKALGGGVAKVSALLIDRARYVEDFDMVRGSTFAEDDFSSDVALATLRALDAHDASGRAVQLGERIGRRLRQAQARFPRVITAVEGRGLMWGVTLAFPNDPAATVTAAFARKGIGYVSASYMLHVHRVRVMPTTSAPDTLRIEPSIQLGDDQIEQMGAALEAVAEAWDTSNLFELIAHCVPGEPDLSEQRVMARHYASMVQDGFQIVREPAAPDATRVAFVHNPVHTTKLLLADAPPLALLTSEQRLELIDRFQRLLEFEPMPSFSKNLFDGRVWMQGITVAATPMVLDHLKRRRQLELLHRQMQRALDMAVEAGCEVVTFGAYTSVISSSATTLHAPPGVIVSSGNSFTVAATISQLLTACRGHGVALDDGARRRVAVVGALGNIGRALAMMLHVHMGLEVELVLVGRAGSVARLERLREELEAAWVTHHSGTAPSVTLADSLEPLSECDVVIASVNAPEPLIYPRHVARDRPVVLADLSEPRATSPHTLEARPGARLFELGFVPLPQDQDFTLSAHSPRGQAFACASEGILMGLDPQPSWRLRGPIDVDVVRKLYELGRTHGMLA